MTTFTMLRHDDGAPEPAEEREARTSEDNVSISKTKKTAEILIRRDAFVLHTTRNEVTPIADEKCGSRANTHRGRDTRASFA